jgi:3-oxoacyl-[acyl-carrier protein] reductase
MKNNHTPGCTFDFKGKTALVTGAGGGIGSAITAAFAEAGAAVALHYHHSRQKAQQLVDELGASCVHAAAFHAGLADENEVKRMFAGVEAEFGGVDILVNNAGVFPVSSLLDMEAGQWDAMIETNLRSVFLCTRAAAPQMIQKGSGVILNIASIEASQPAAGHAHYSTSKAAVLMLTRSSANELGPHGIRVNAISPGLIDREGLEEAWPEGVASYRRTAPLGTLGKPQDIAGACLFLASPTARWITGVDLTVDGGISNRPLI